MSLAAFRQDALNYKPKSSSERKDLPIFPKKKKTFPWRINYIKELKPDRKTYPKGEVLADIDAVEIKTGIILQGVTLVRYGRDTIFMLPNYQQDLKNRPENERPKRRHIRLNGRRAADYFQTIMTRVLREYMKANPSALSRRCNPRVPEEIQERINTYKQNQEAGKIRKRAAWQRYNPGKLAK